MENLIAKNEESALLHIESNYGKFTTDWYRQVGGVEERQIGDDFVVISYTGNCPCGYSLHYGVRRKIDYEPLADYIICESCYREEGGDDEGINGIIYILFK